MQILLALQLGVHLLHICCQPRAVIECCIRPGAELLSLSACVCRASRPFGKTPLRLPSGGGSGEGLSGSPEQEPEPLAWTPMRAAAMTPQTGGLRGFGLKRMREGEGTPGTPLLAAGHASEAARRIRQRSDQVSFRIKLPLQGDHITSRCLCPLCSHGTSYCIHRLPLRLQAILSLLGRVVRSCKDLSLPMCFAGSG